MLHPRALTAILWVTLAFAFPWPIYNHDIMIQPPLFTLIHTEIAYSIVAILSQAIFAIIVLLILSMVIIKQLRRLVAPLPISFAGLIILSLLFFTSTYPVYSPDHGQHYDLRGVYQYSPIQQEITPTTPPIP